MNEVDAFLEQLDAAHAVANHYTCIVCKQRRGVKAGVIIEDLPDGGCHAMIVVVCENCDLTSLTNCDILH